MRFYCPQCWADFPEDVARCPRCELDIQGFMDEKSFREKLLIALNHPEQTARLRAVTLLGRLREERAVEPLISLLRRTRDVYMAVAVVQALRKFDRPDVRAVLRSMTAHPARMVREEAQRTVEALETEEKVQQ